MLTTLNVWAKVQTSFLQALFTLSAACAADGTRLLHFSSLKFCGQRCTKNKWAIHSEYNALYSGFSIFAHVDLLVHFNEALFLQFWLPKRFPYYVHFCKVLIDNTRARQQTYVLPQDFINSIVARRVVTSSSLRIIIASRRLYKQDCCAGFMACSCKVAM